MCSEKPTTDAKPRLFCRNCGYDLVGLSLEGVCPECGELVAVSVGWRDRARSVATISLVLAAVVILGYPWLQLWTLVLSGWGTLMAAGALFGAMPGVRSRTTRKLAMLAITLHALLFGTGFVRLVVTGWPV